jgi:hypothetical protein
MSAPAPKGAWATWPWISVVEATDPAAHGATQRASAGHHRQDQFRVGPSGTQSARVAVDMVPVWLLTTIQSRVLLDFTAWIDTLISTFRTLSSIGMPLSWLAI